MSSITNATARPGLHHLEGLGVAVGRDDVHAEVLRGVDLGDLLDVGRARGRDDRLALEVVERLDVRRLLGDPAVGGHEVRDREADLLLALEVVGGRAALEVDGAVGDAAGCGWPR